MKALIGKSLAVFLASFFLVGGAMAAETCTSANDLDAQTRASMEKTAHSVFNMAARGDVFNLKTNAVPSLASSFGGVEQAVSDSKANLGGVQPTIRNLYFLDASDEKGTIQRAEFFCGVFNSTDRTGFVLNNLPAGQYGIVVLDAPGAKPMTMSLVLQVMNGAWKIGGFYLKPAMLAGHDGNWYWQQAKQFAAQGKKHNAYFYYLEARELLAPVPFMTTPSLDKLYDEIEAANPHDLPGDNPVTIAGADGKSYQVTFVSPLVVQDALALVLRQKVADASNTATAFQENMGLIKAAVAKWPETREIFTTVVARAQDANGQDYGSLLPMKDIK
ncbi:hypothetical protein Acid345_0778 [Candidatus Koribacter versatilis Ellin345]|uniref:DUF1254 domain-containing protein n=1 Tax=Koribacter versatilis (strain Ellin345) TaxID=204669 RepID=Q1ITL7_KORVE|nr:hypothetical protein [Candidatus Koribacter versatilis]ABF39783.1 hypothetical protein Acid345_0778 [Candidatus Koribacter versatilis Ellin345]